MELLLAWLGLDSTPLVKYDADKIQSRKRRQSQDVAGSSSVVYVMSPVPGSPPVPISPSPSPSPPPSTSSLLSSVSPAFPTSTLTARGSTHVSPASPPHHHGFPGFIYSTENLVEEALRQDNLLEHGLQRLDRGVWTVQEILGMTEGRDKLYKVLQNCCKIGRWHYAVNDRNDELRTKFDTVHKFSKITRIYLKMFNLSSFVRLFVRVLRLQHNSILKVLALGRLGGLAIYFFCQYPTWLYLHGVAPRLHDRWWKRVALLGYIASALCSFTLDLHRMNQVITALRDLQAQRRHTSLMTTGVSSSSSSSSSLSSSSFSSSASSSSTSTAAVEENADALTITHAEAHLLITLKELFVNFFKDSLDFAVAWNDFLYLGWNDGVQGVLGVAAGCISLHRLWRRKREARVYS